MLNSDHRLNSILEYPLIPGWKVPSRTPVEIAEPEPEPEPVYEANHSSSASSPGGMSPRAPLSPKITVIAPNGLGYRGST